MQRLGSRIRARRENLSVQVNDLAALIGVTPSLISQIERARAFPSIITLKKIAEALQTTVGILIGENETYSDNPMVRFDEKKLVQTNEQGTTLYLLSNHDLQKSMEPYLLEFPNHANAATLINPMHGQSFYYMLRGSVEVDMGKQKYTLGEGDSFYLNSAIKHAICNSGKGLAMLLWISTNPVM